MKNIYIPVIIHVLICTSVFAVNQGDALLQREGDYTHRPLLEVTYTGLEAGLEAGFDEGLIRGEVEYRFMPKHAGVDQLIWLAPESNILDLALDGRPLSYNRNGDTLVIRFDEHPDPENRYTIRMTYETEPGFGIHVNHSGTIFTSSLPGGVSHWLPGPVHPRVSMPVQLAIHVPEEQTAVSVGEAAGEEATQEGTRYHWVSERAVPLSELAFAAGDFEFTETFMGVKNVRIYHETGVLDEEERQYFLEYTVTRMRQLERMMRRELPLASYQIVVLADDRWETRPYASGFNYVFQSMGNPELQISRSLIAQWFGISLRAEQWERSGYITLLQAILAEQADIPDWESVQNPLQQAFHIPETLYDKAGMDVWQWARSYVRDNEFALPVATLTASLRELSGNEGTWSSGDFSRHLYDLTGRLVDEPVITEPAPEPDFRFLAVIDGNGTTGETNIEITPLGDVSDDEFEITIMWDRDGRIFQNSYTFQGNGETLQINTDGRVNNILIEKPDESVYDIEVEKPFAFWLYQLRRDENLTRRIEAARALMNYTDDPDLQLAIQDVINQVENPDLQVELQRLMAAITSGARGTERRFLDGIEDDNPEFRIVSMQALKAYPGNATVEEEVLSVIQYSDDIALVNEAIRTYRVIIDPEEFRDFVLRFLREDRDELLFTETLLEELHEVPASEGSISAAGHYLNNPYPFHLRWLGYRYLRTHADNNEWQRNFLDTCYNDNDPRIRFVALFSVPGLEPDERTIFLEERMTEEYDIRILNRIADLIDTD